MKLLMCKRSFCFFENSLFIQSYYAPFTRLSTNNALTGNRQRAPGLLGIRRCSGFDESIDDIPGEFILRLEPIGRHQVSVVDELRLLAGQDLDLLEGELAVRLHRLGHDEVEEYDAEEQETEEEYEQQHPLFDTLHVADAIEAEVADGDADDVQEVAPGAVQLVILEHGHARLELIVELHRAEPVLIRALMVQVAELEDCEAEAEDIRAENHHGKEVPEVQK